MKKTDGIPYVPCGGCSSGFITVIRGGERWCERCGCWLRWKDIFRSPMAKPLRLEGRHE